MEGGRNSTHVQRIALKVVVAFFALTLLLTLLVRAAASWITPVVTLTSPSQGILRHEVYAQGTVEAREVSAVLATPGVMVEGIAVTMGQKAEQGAELARFSQEDVASKIATLERAMDRLRLQEKLASMGVNGGGSLDAGLDVAITRAKDALEEAEERLGQVERGEDMTLYDLEYQIEQDLMEIKRKEEDASRTGDLVGVARMRDDYQQRILRGEYQMAAQRTVLLEAARADVDSARREWEDALARQQQALDDLTTQQAALGTDVISRSLQAQIIALDIQEKQEELFLLEAIMETQCILRSPCDGYIVGIGISPGRRCEELAFLIAKDWDAGAFYLHASADPVALRGIRLGTPVSIRPSGAAAYQTFGALVEEIREDEVVISLPNGILRADDSVELLFTRESDSFPLRVPSAAVRYGEDGGRYVLVMREKNGILGKSMLAEAVSISILEDDGNMAAIDPSGILGNDDRIVATSTKPVQPGDTVRLR